MPVKSWVPLEESLQPLLDQINIIPYNNLNICPSLHPSPPSGDKCSPHPTSREFSLQQWLLQKTTTIIAQTYGAQCQWICLQKTPIPEAQGTFPNRGWKDWKSQRTRGFAERMCLLVMSAATPMKSHHHDCLPTQELKEDNQSSPGMSTLTGYPGPQGQPWRNPHEQHCADWAGYNQDYIWVYIQAWNNN